YIRIIGFQNKRAEWKFENLRIYAARFVRFSASTTLVFNVLSHLPIFYFFIKSNHSPRFLLSIQVNCHYLKRERIFMNTTIIDFISNYGYLAVAILIAVENIFRSEERRVGKEDRCWST